MLPQFIEAIFQDQPGRIIGKTLALIFRENTDPKGEVAMPGIPGYQIDPSDKFSIKRVDGKACRWLCLLELTGGLQLLGVLLQRNWRQVQLVSR